VKFGPLTVTLGKAATSAVVTTVPGAAPAPVPSPSYGTAYQAVRTTDLAELARRTVGEDLGPGVPMIPTHPEKIEPRMFDYVPGFNITFTPRTYEDIQFGALRGLARSWDVAALCIQRNIDDLRQLRWEIRPKAVPGMDRSAVKERKKRLEATRAEVEGFWMTPDQRRSWSSWVHSYFQEMYETDAACLYLERARDGTLRRVRVIDGTTIAPLVDDLGEPPEPPQPAYRQIIRGLPWTYYMADLELPADQRNVWFDQAHMIYEPFWGRPDSPYGHPPMEWVMLTTQRALARQVLDYRLFADGTTAFDFWKMPPDWSATQIAELQEAHDTLLKMPKERARLRFMPGGANSGLEHGFLEPKTEGEEFLLHVGCAAFNRSPMEMGFIRSSGGAGLGGKGVAKEQGAAANKGVRAAAFHLKAIIDRITGLHFSPELEIIFPELEDTEAAKERAEAEDIRIRNGSLGLDEARLDRDLDPIGPSGKPSNLIYLGTNPPMQAVLALSQEAPEPPPGGDNPPIPSAVPGKATDTASGVAKALGGKHLEFRGDLSRVVSRYLLRSYPGKDVSWVTDPDIDWEYDPGVPLDEINMARRPGGRNETKVAEIAGIVDAGASVDPIVLADFGEPKYRIADGFHRTLGAEKAGKDAIPAFIGHHVPAEYRALVMGPMQDDSASVAKGDARVDLDRWMRKSLGAAKRGQSPLVRFESDAIPASLREQVTAALPFAASPAAIRAIFDVLGADLAKSSALVVHEPAPVSTRADRAQQALDAVERITKADANEAEGVMVLAGAVARMADAMAIPQPAPIVNVAAPVVNVPAPLVKIAAQPAPIVNVPAPIVRVTTDNAPVAKAFDALREEMHRPRVKTVERDAAGRPTRVTEE
jgi:hypothetical protein